MSVSTCEHFVLEALMFLYWRIVGIIHVDMEETQDNLRVSNHCYLQCRFYTELLHGQGSP